jgi:hypothetical protein
LSSVKTTIDRADLLSRTTAQMKKRSNRVHVPKGPIDPPPTTTSNPNKLHTNPTASIVKLLLLILLGGGAGICIGMLIAIEITSTVNGTLTLQQYSRGIHHHIDKLSMFNVPMVALPAANPRAVPPIDTTWIKQIENANGKLRGGTADGPVNAKIVIPDSLSLSPTSNGKKCVPLQGKPSDSMYHAQDAQDQLVNYVLKGKTHGFFVEFGAGDGSFHSNSKFFETQLCWTGLCTAQDIVLFCIALFLFDNMYVICNKLIKL